MQSLYSYFRTFRRGALLSAAGLLFVSCFSSSHAEVDNAVYQRQVDHDASAIVAVEVPRLLSDDTVQAEGDKPEKKTFLVAPLINSSPAFGTGLGATAMWFFKFDEEDSSPSSVLQPIGLYSNTDSYVFGALSQIYLDDDTHRIIAFAGKGKINNDFSNIAGEYGLGSIRFASSFKGAFMRYQYRLFEKLYAGVEAMRGEVDFVAADSNSQNYLDLVGAESSTVGGIGPIVSYDTRNHPMYPTAGVAMELKWNAYGRLIDADDEYDTVEATFRHFKEFRSNHVLASRLKIKSAFNNPPYTGLSSLGGVDARGYIHGEYLGENLLSAQAEYRWQFATRWAAVGFGGVALLTDSALLDISSEEIYPTAGLGIRFLLLADQKVNFRVDYAKGKSSNDGFYISVRESF